MGENAGGLDDVRQLVNSDGHVPLVADEEQVRCAMEHAEAALGGLDVMIANAAVHFRHRMACVASSTWTLGQ